jgi:hypothetical protein
VSVVPDEEDGVAWFWANRAYETGVSPRPIARGDLTTDALFQAVDCATSSKTSQKWVTPHRCEC